MSTAQEGKFIHHKRDGKSYYFCSEHCLTTFKTDPEKFTGKKEEAPSAVKHTHDSSEVYACRCTLKSSSRAPVVAQNAAWPWSRRPRCR
ncbi:MAG: YHS domain-containing protein [Pseudomonadota bacterium]